MKKGDIVIVVVVLILALVGGSIYYFNSGGPEDGAMIVVEVNGVEIDRKPLVEADRDLIEVYQGPAGETMVQFFQRGARVLESDCPDKICINFGMMDRPALNNACLPNRVVFRIVGGNEDLDINTR
ncbi:NusG domain II-containing protein [Alkalicella caledoniensis]|uniref:NusG domain II-containing protein n=1 Tax=Alkalicella caledoniensis TaxID=2731377 RepID=A0A7G9W4K4_ALKCA|nr:NusG domain II-containing protein [Alkalicella caledoniensis]QNO13616.1 NusG domain II-containing protein [Alkalicella caledoniensis]